MPSTARTISCTPLPLEGSIPGSSGERFAIHLFIPYTIKDKKTLFKI
jgi:hypothetical protein